MPRKNSHYSVILRLAGIIVILALAGILGMMLGRWTAPDFAPLTPVAEKPSPPPSAPMMEAEETIAEKETPPIFFCIGEIPEGNLSLILEQVSMARDAGVHQYVLPVPFPWGGPRELEESMQLVEAVINTDPHAAFLLKLNLNPPEEWLATHPEDRMVVGGESRPYATPASRVWIEETGKVLAAVVAGMELSPHTNRVLGYLLTALGEERWSNKGGFDQSPANLRAFRQWLRRNYREEAVLREAWNEPDAAFDAVAIPRKPDPAPGESVFLTLPQMQPVADYQRFISEITADAIATFAALVRSVAETPVNILVPYGYAFELTNNDAGHFALGVLLSSEVDGFVSPVSAIDRGVGGAGGMMGPVDTVRYHGKSWMLLDDTRTGVAWDPAAGQTVRMKGLVLDDVFNVQRRNFAAALVHRMGIAFTDPLGEGWLHDADIWNRIGQMRQIYAQAQSEEDVFFGPFVPPGFEAHAVVATPMSADEMPLPDSDKGTSDVQEGHFEDGDAYDVGDDAVKMLEAWFDQPSGLMVVVDEISRFYQQGDPRLNELLLCAARDAAVRAALPLQFCLLQDVLDDIADPMPVYLFLNAFRLTAPERERLHARLAREGAAAIWLYAPGYISGTADAAHVAKTVGMKVGVFDGPARTGSLFVLQGRGMREGEEFGNALEIQPLFFIQDPDADVLAQYRQTDRASVAMRQTDAGWTSVFCAEPNLTPELLREILSLLDQHLYLPTGGPVDAVHAGGRLIAIHARNAGDRMVALNGLFNVIDLFDPATGWINRDGFVFGMRSGETRLFQLSAP